MTPGGHPVHLHDLLDRAAGARPDQVALRVDAGAITYGELAAASRAQAVRLSRRGVGRGERVALLLPNGAPAVASLFAASRLGAIFAPLHPDLKPRQLAYVLDDLAPAAVITTGALADRHGLAHDPRIVLGGEEAGSEEGAELPPTPAISSDPVSLLYTSGSTGMPKAVISTHRNIVFAARAIQDRLGVRASDTIGSFLPLSFDYGLYQAFLACLAGATLALGAPEQAGPGLVRRLLACGATAVPLVPTLAAALIELSRRARERPPVRFFTNTGAHLSRAQIDALAELYPGARTFVMFGITECKRVSILDPDDHPRRPTSVGKPLADTECVIVDDAGRPLPPGQQGELVVRGPHVMAGYWNAPELTDRRFRRWGAGLERALFTGDRCSLDDEGYLYFHGRSDDIYKQGGHRVSALEVEAAALEIEGVRQASVVLAEGGDAILFVAGTLTEGELVAGLRERLEDHKIPPRIQRVDELPLTANGKVDGQALRARIEAGP